MRILFRSVPFFAVYGFLVALPACGLRTTLDSEGAESAARDGASSSGKLDAPPAISSSNSSPDVAFVSDLGLAGAPDLRTNDLARIQPVHSG